MLEASFACDGVEALEEPRNLAVLEEKALTQLVAHDHGWHQRERARVACQEPHRGHVIHFRQHRDLHTELLAECVELGAKLALSSGEEHPHACDALREAE